jgi:8-oxo-dGTP pyrophosphatase MutT (NUDIX family)
MGIRIDHRNIASICVVSRDGHCIVIQRPENDPGVFGKEYPFELPSGGCDRWESPKRAAVREASEEIGLIIKRADLVPVSRALDVNVEYKRDGSKVVTIRLVHRYAVFRPENHETLLDQVQLSEEHVKKLALPIEEEVLRNCRGLPDVFQSFALEARKIGKRLGKLN